MPSRFNELLGNQQYVDQYVPLPLNLIAQQGAAKQKMHDIGEAERIDLLGKQVNSLQQDIPKVLEEKAKIDKDLENFSNKDFSDPIVQREWYSKKREITDKFGPQGNLGTIQSNYDAFNQYKNEQIKNLKDSGWGEADIRNWVEKEKQNFTGTIKQDGTGFNYFQGKSVNPYVDQTEWMSKALKDVAADTGVMSLTKYGSLNEVTDAFKSGEIEHKDASKIINALAKRAIGDVKLRKSLEQEGLFSGQEGWSNIVKGQDASGNVIPNENTPFGQALLGIAQGAAYKKVKEDYMKVEDATKLEDYKRKKDASNFTLFNQSVLTPGEKTDFQSLNATIGNIKDQLAQLPAVGSQNDNYQTTQQRKALEMKLKTSENYLNTASTSYYNTAQGEQELKNQYKQSSKTNLVGNYSGIGKLLNDPEIKNYIKNENDFVKFAKGQLTIPKELEDKKFSEIVSSLSGSGATGKSTMSLKDYINNYNSRNVSDYVENNPISYSANVLTGGDKSTVGQVNKELTDRVLANGTNYYVPDGVDLNTYLTQHGYNPKTDKLSVAAMDDDIGGQFAHYMSLTKEDGSRIELPIYPADGGRSEQGMIGKRLIDENKNQAEPQEKENYNRGQRMLANSLYGDALNDEYLKSYENNARPNSGTSVNTPLITISVPNIGNIEGSVKITKKGGLTYYQLMNSKGKPITDEEKSINDLRVSLLEIQ